MPKYRIQAPDGNFFEVNAPDGASEDEVMSYAKSQFSQHAKPQTLPGSVEGDYQYEPSLGQKISKNTLNAVSGAVRGAGQIGATAMWQGDKAGDIADWITGQRKGMPSRNDQRRADMDTALKDMVGAQPDSLAFKGGKLTAEIAGTAGMGGLAANAIRGMAPTLSASQFGAPLVNAIGSSGFTTGAPAAAGLGGWAANMGTRMAGGAITGGLSGAAIDPSQAGMGAAFGAAAPPALAGLGKIGSLIGQAMPGMRAAARSPEMQAAIESARGAGYVIPPTQAKPTMVNRALEGFAGKLTTAQNASAKNQPITNALAAKSVGADGLSEAALNTVKERAGAAYDQIKTVGTFGTDDAFREALSKAGAASAKMKADFPKLVNNEVESLIDDLASRPGFDSATTIEAIKQFRFEGAANKASMEPAKKALGAAQMKISNAMEDLIDRNLQATGAQDLLASYRGARTTFAKLYDIEKALNKESRNVDAAKLGALLDKGRPLTGELRQVAGFAKAFPKAVQTTERMGSLPGISPLDFAALGTASAASANPMLMAGVVARPMARAAVLSPMVQNGLVRPMGLGFPSQLGGLLGSPDPYLQFLYRAGPAAVPGW